MKAITRTITVYKYTTGVLDITTMQISNMQTNSYPYKLSTRERRKHEAICGAPIIAESSEEKLYSMPLETFLKYATPVEDGEEVKEDKEAENK